MNIQNDVFGLVLRENCKSKQMTDIIAWPSRCHGRILHINSYCTDNYLHYLIIQWDIWLVRSQNQRQFLTLTTAVDFGSVLVAALYIINVHIQDFSQHVQIPVDITNTSNVVRGAKRISVRTTIMFNMLVCMIKLYDQSNFRVFK